MNISSLGRLRRTADGRCVLTFDRTYPHPPAKVWRAITEPEHLRGWFAQYLDYDRSRLDLASREAVLEFAPRDGDEATPVANGRVLQCAPPTLLEYTWGDEILRWDLAPVPQGCRLTFTITFTDPSFAPFNGLGWHTGLDRLGAVLDGADPGGIAIEVDAAAADELQARYEQAFA